MFYHKEQYNFFSCFIMSFHIFTTSDMNNQGTINSSGATENNPGTINSSGATENNQETINSRSAQNIINELDENNEENIGSKGEDIINIDIDAAEIELADGANELITVIATSEQQFQL